MENRAFAPAKVNLTLHVTGQRADGYHLLGSLVVFVGVGDRITVAPAQALGLTVTGPRAAGVPTGPENLVLRAAALLGAGGAEITLEKHLPAAAGIGGGSSDAAASLRALSALWGVDLPADRGLSLGADVPVCLRAAPCIMSGVGEVLTDVPALPAMWMVLVNPGVEVPTPAVFRGLSRKDNPPMAEVPEGLNAQGFADWLATQRNDLEPPARAIAPVIGDVLEAISASGALIARMSGSGATCFGLFADADSAGAAAHQIKEKAPAWWVDHGALGSFA
ncbi:4-(cytidine 5'-diphospho)-2-C-methyl-D-erythritol kinase [Donghicola mangrovi]|uniref:4-diphosphocytidyl-2-C-methyl-D-erythritol kinase n=1 Tax=Donghicola mangrovi TaxID=2729614 RepID=A0A850Q1R2_9RHOB|nr:4-(cytidine 5'-diphospho)-2-C-methyl-D-erythritol kinase [Donghicola mangrovi]NVO21852.1 4-(cytidine 5'-diphospho)-2-C-methyl-D-erythritol kinase [Donghicola mangrovi]